VTGEGSTSVSGTLGLADDEPRPDHERLGPVRIVRALVRLARAWRRLAHVPTLGQVCAMAWFDGREPCSYLLDRAVNFVPEPMQFGYESELGRHALCFTCQDPYGRAMELVMMRDGGGFDLLSGC
jgi:hypothetical protein